DVGTLGGYLSWKYGPFFAIIAGVWSILALSGTLATEAQRGSLDFVAVAPFGKRRVALAKLAAHLTVMALVVLILAISAWVAGAAPGPRSSRWPPPPRSATPSGPRRSRAGTSA